VNPRVSRCAEGRDRLRAFEIIKTTDSESSVSWVGSGIENIMKTTRMAIGLAAALFVLGPLIGLGHLSRDILFFDDFERRGYIMPVLSEALLPFGPLWWWSYITPVALGVAAAGWVRLPVQAIGLVTMLAAGVLQFFTIMAVYGPYFHMTARMGNFMPVYPTIPLVANVCLVGVSIGLASHSVARLVAENRRHGENGSRE
jgi:hypothetical protein